MPRFVMTLIPPFFQRLLISLLPKFISDFRPISSRHIKDSTLQMSLAHLNKLFDARKS
jgi:hypothetical protein